MVTNSRYTGSVKRPSVFIEGDRLLPEDIKPWKGSGSVPMRVTPHGLGVLQVSKTKKNLMTISSNDCLFAIYRRTRLQTKEPVSRLVSETA